MRSYPYEFQNAIHTMAKHNLSTVEDLQAKMLECMDWDRWLGAEDAWKRQVREWLAAEKRWKAIEYLHLTSEVMQAAERGWLAMRSMCRNLDGVANFQMLGIPLQERYAVFAAAALGQEAPRFPSGDE